MKNFWTLFLQKDIPWIVIRTAMFGMVLSQIIAIIGPRTWKEAAKHAYSLHSETWLEWRFSFWPPLIFALTLGAIRMACAVLRARNDWHPLK